MYPAKMRKKRVTDEITERVTRLAYFWQMVLPRGLAQSNMHTLTLFVLGLLLGGTPGKNAAGSNISQTVVVSMQSGDASRLSTGFARTIDLVIDSEKVSFPAVQASHAQLILRSFFRKYPPHRFQLTYEGSSDRLRYSTGTYESNGKQFSVYVLMRQISNQQYVINALHFRKEA